MKWQLRTLAALVAVEFALLVYQVRKQSLLRREQDRIEHLYITSRDEMIRIAAARRASTRATTSPAVGKAMGAQP